jgi:DNA-binding response OmpR family regulator
VILVVDDDIDLRSIVRGALEREGFAVDEAGDGAIALTKIATLEPELVVLDLGLPNVGGLEVLRAVGNADDSTPVIVLSGRSDETDRIVGLELGADDYVTKPFSPRELVARVRSVLRRAGGPRARDVYEFDGLRIDSRTREVEVRGQPVELRRLEFDLLEFLCAAPQQVFTREQLLVNVWHSAPDWQDSATVSEHVHRLRHKIEDDPSTPRRIVTVRGVGYRFEP